MDSSSSLLHNCPPPPTPTTTTTASTPAPAPPLPAPASASASASAALSPSPHCHQVRLALQNCIFLRLALYATTPPRIPFSCNCASAKRARLTPPLTTRTSPGGTSYSNQIGLKGGAPVDEPHCGNSTEEISRMTTAVSPRTPKKADDSNGHLLDSKIIQSRFTEEELAAEPLLGVANWLNCAPSDLRVPADLTSPAPKYHLHNSGGAEQSESKEPGAAATGGSPSGSGKEHKKVVISAADPTLYVWDLDETLIIFQTLRNGRYAELFRGSKDPSEACELGKRWEALILDICDEYFFYKQVEDYNEPCLLSLQNFDDTADLSRYNFDSDNLTVPVDAANKRKLAYRHRVVGELYCEGLEKLLNQDQLTEWKNLYEATDAFTDGWLTAGREIIDACLRENQKKVENRPKSTGNPSESSNSVDCDPILQGNTSVSNYNILVTSGTLIPSLVKCLLFRLDKYFHPLNIYSSREFGKLQCFYWIKERVQSLPLRFCVIGDGIDECEAALDLSWPFLKIDSGPSAIHQISTVTTDIVEHCMNIIYDPSLNT